jgi:hypothetical protein
MSAASGKRSGLSHLLCIVSFQSCNPQTQSKINTCFCQLGVCPFPRNVCLFYALTSQGRPGPYSPPLTP